MPGLDFRFTLQCRAMSKPAFTWMGASALMSSGMQPCSTRQHLVEEEQRRGGEKRRAEERRGEVGWAELGIEVVCGQMMWPPRCAPSTTHSAASLRTQPPRCTFFFLRKRRKRGGDLQPFAPAAQGNTRLIAYSNQTLGIII